MGEKAILPTLRSKLGALKYCCRKLPISSRKLLATGLIVSRLVYLLPVYGGTCRKYFNKLQVVLNNTARFVTGLGKRTSKRPLMVACGWLDIEEMIVYHSILQMWRTINLKVPLYLYRKLTINEDTTIETTIPRLQNTQIGYRWQTVQNWNELSQDIRENKSLISFKKQVKKWLVEKRTPDPGPVEMDE